MEIQDTTPRVGDEVNLHAIELEQSPIDQNVGRIKSLARKALGIGALSLTAGVGLSTVVPTETDCGPHRCEVLLQFDNFATIDAGPLGPVRVPIEQKYAVPTGVKLRLKELPNDTASNPTDQPILDQKAEILDESRVQELAQLYSTAPDDLTNIPKKMVQHIGMLSGGAAAGTTAGYALLGKRRRQELTEKTSGLTRIAAPALLSFALISPPVIPVESAQSEWQSSGTVFNGTPLEGLETRGTFWRYSLEGIRQVAEYQQEIEDYYESLADATEIALNRFRPFKTLEGQPNIVRVIRTADIHCNYGMNNVLTTASETAGVDIWVDNGDMVMSGSRFEYLCIDAIARNMPESRIISPGNHESDESISQLKDAGFIVVDGTVQTIKGIPFIGLPDPNRSPFGGTERYSNHRTRQTGRALLTAACAEENKPILLTHYKVMAEETIQAGCADLGFGGHAHNEERHNILQQDGGSGMFFTAGSSGGVQKNEPTIDKLRAPAYVYLDAFEVSSDGSATLLESNAVIISPDGAVVVENSYTESER